MKSQQNGFIILNTVHTEECDPDNKTQGLPVTPFLGQIIVNTTIYLPMTSLLKTCHLQLGLETSHSHDGDQVYETLEDNLSFIKMDKNQVIEFKGNPSLGPFSIPEWKN